MAVKKSELYSKIWAACDELGRGIDPAIYKNYILTLIFIKYVSDKYANDPYATIRIPAGATFAEMSKLKGNPNIGDVINKKIVEPLFSANNLSGYPDFNSSQNLGEGKEKVERLTNLIATFEDQALDFSGNRAENDDLLGDTYEYLMRNFAIETGKSKGQFYTPAEVSRVIAAIVGIRDVATNAQTTIYDPACGSGSLRSAQRGPLGCCGGNARAYRARHGLCC
jgi:type I restriction enzyme M protein